MKTTNVINALRLVRQTRGNIKCEARGKDGKFALIKGIEIRESEDISEKTGTRNLHVFIDTE